VYTPSHFAVADRNAQLELIDRHPFGTLTTVSAGRARISTVPFLIGPGRASLDGHLARANPHWREFDVVTDVVVCFVGPNAYISPNWYQSPDMVPTWNYVAIEARGRIELLDSRAARLDIVDRLSARHGADLSRQWTSDKMNPELRDKLLDAIVAFRLHIEAIEAKAKLGQNRKPEDLRSAAAALDVSDAVSYPRQVAALMRGVID